MSHLLLDCWEKQTHFLKHFSMYIAFGEKKIKTYIASFIFNLKQNQQKNLPFIQHFQTFAYYKQSKIRQKINIKKALISVET